MKALSQQRLNQLQQMLGAAQQELKSGRIPQAETLYLDVLKEVPEAWDVHHAVAMIYARTNRPKQAVKHLQRIVHANPTHAVSHANLAMALSEAEDYKQALIAFQRALALDSKLTSLYLPYAETYRRAKKHEAAIALYKKILDSDKVNHAAFHGLGLVYRDMEELPRALECFECAVSLEPKNADYHMNFAVSLKKYGLINLAAEQYYEAIKLRPHWLEAVVLLAETLEEQRRFDEAIECLDLALSLSNHNLEIIERKGYVYMALGDTERALKEFNQVLSEQPDRFMARLGLCRTYMEAGRTEDAVLNLDAFISDFPENSQGYFYLASTRKFSVEDPVIPKIKAITESVALDQDAAIGLNFAMGKIYDDCKLWDQAFHHYALANKLRNEQLIYDHSIEVARNNRTIEVFSREFIVQNESIGSNSDAPIFIIGMPRSGTTLTEQIISSHPDVMGAGEVIFWGTAPKALPYTLGTTTDYPECAMEITPVIANEIASKYLEMIRKIVGSTANHSHITDKMPHNFLYLGLIALIFPKAKFIHCKRNAMDNCLSIYFQNFATGHQYAYDLKNLGLHHLEYQRLMNHWQTVLPGKVFDLNYEDVISDPEFWSRKLIAHVGLDWSDACLTPHRLERTVKTASHWQVRQPIYKTSVQRWKHYESHLLTLKETLGIK